MTFFHASVVIILWLIGSAIHRIADALETIVKRSYTDDAE